jgi:hypothetical protein
MQKLTGMLLYVQLNKPAKGYVKPGSPPKADEWKASVAITDEDVLDEYEAFTKQIDAATSIKKVKVADFEAIYKTAAPEDADKNVWIITLRKSTELGKTGKPVPDLYKPKVFEKVGTTLIDVTNSKLPANGSYGSISIDKFERTNGTTSLYLKNVLVTEMIEYIAEESTYNAGDEFGESTEKPVTKQKVEEKPKAEVKPKARAKVVTGFDDMDDDIPF